MPTYSTSLQFQDLCCERDDRTLFYGLSHDCQPGSLLRVAGPNGAGKTTLLRILAGLYDADSGSVQINLTPHHDAREHILYFGHKPQVSRELSVMENLRFLTGAADVTIEDALVAVGLAGEYDSLVRELSQGQGRRCALARLWCNEAPIWILDEPYTALDVKMVATLDAQINAHLANGGLCIFTTHQAPQSLVFETLELGRVG